jgi:hypothetical protein
MKWFRVAIPLFLLLAIAPGARAQGAGWDAVDKVFGTPGKDMPGDVHRFGWPRSDLHVTIKGVPVEPALALGSWGAFQKTGTGDEAVAMGDLVLLGSEVDPVIGELQAGGFEILAVHNHLIGEMPRVLYLHFHGHGDAAALARTLKAALAKTRTPTAAGKTPSKPTAAQEKTFEKLQESLGQKGTMAGTVLQVGVPRAEAIREGDREVPASMGMANSMNFATVGNRVATTGDFVLIADEVNPVIKELRSHGLEITALHSHMLRETPRLFFMHFWGVGSPEKIGPGLKAALSKVATK